MELNNLIKLLGLGFLDGKVEAAFQEFGVRRRPKLEIDEEDVDGPVVGVQDWVISSRCGIEFGFEDEASFLGLGRSEFGSGPLVLTQIYLYGDHDGVNPYQGALPFGLTMGDKRVTVREKLVKFEDSRKSYLRDTWMFPKFRMVVSYVEDGERIGFILLIFNPPVKSGLERAVEIPNIEDIIKVLGKDKDDFLVAKIFSPFRLHFRMIDEGQEYSADFREDFGFALRFRNYKGLKKKSSIYKLSHITFFRDREMEASRYGGRLPHNIEFDDSPEELMKKVRQPPDKITDEDFVGYALWHLTEYSLRVKYSTMVNCVLAVDLLASGVWESYYDG